MAKESDVWRIVHRKEYERTIEPKNIRVGQVVRITTKSSVLDFTGFVKKVSEVISLHITSGPEEGKHLEFELGECVSATEILSCPLWHRLKKNVRGSKVRGGTNLP